MIEAVFFYVLSGIMLLAAAMVVTARNPVYAVLYLILAFFNAAGLFVMLGAEFVAMILVIVYVGAVAVLFLFVVMMLDIDFEEMRKGFWRHAPVGGLIGLVLLGELVWMFLGWAPAPNAATLVSHPSPDAAVITNTHALGMILYTDYVYLFQIAGLILLVAMIGAIALTLRDRPDLRRQSVAKQVDRNPKDVLKVEKITTGAGVS